MLYVSQFCICNTCCPQLTTAPLFFQVSQFSIIAIEQELEVAMVAATTITITLTKATILVGAATSGGEIKINVCEFVIACYTLRNNRLKLGSNLIGLI